MDARRLRALLDHYPALTIGLLGDLFLDRYLQLAPGVREMSIETGLEAWQVSAVRNAPGALGTVLNNLAALGVGRLLPVTVIGDDGHAHELCQSLQSLPVDARYVLRDPTRLTPTYTKPLRLGNDGQWHELNRLDFRSREPLTAATTGRVIASLRETFTNCDGWIVLDQINESNWGVVNDTVRGELRRLTRQFPDKLLYVDSRAHLGEFDCGLLKGNEAELRRAVSVAHDSAGLEQAARQLAARTGQAVFVTLGPDGMLVVDAAGPPQRVPGVRVAGPIDIVGAGDAATSGIVTALLSGASATEAALIGNLAASITIQQLGATGTATPAQVLERLAAYHHPT